MNAMHKRKNIFGIIAKNFQTSKAYLIWFKF